MNAENYLPALVRVSAQAGVLVLLVLFAQWLFRKQLSPRWRCALWFLVIARLVLPFSPGSAASIFNLVPHWGNLAPAPTVIARTPTQPIAPHTAIPLKPALRVANRPSAPENRVASESATLEEAQPLPSPVGHVATPQLPAEPLTAKISSVTMLLWVWLAGVLILGAYIVACSIRLARSCRGQRTLSDARLLAVRDECARRLGHRTQVAIVESAGVSSPALFGMFRPRLMLPKGFIGNFTEQELRFVFLHELAHLKRHDLLVNWLVTLLQVIHWFNPLLWVGFSRWRSDRELACDALALEAAGADQNREYGRTMLHLLKSFMHRSPSPGLVGILEDKRQLRRRIGMIASFRPGKRGSLLAVVLLAVLGVMGLTDAQTPKPQEPIASARNSAPTNNVSKQVEERVGADPVPEISGTNVELRSLVVSVLNPDGKPLSDAEVFVPYVGDWARPRPRRLTDANGRFTVRFPSLPKDFRRQMSNFSVSARSKDYAQRAVMWTASRGDVYAGMPGEVTIKLERGIAIGGIVKDQQGRPLTGVRVLLSASGYRGFTVGTNERNTHEYSEVRMSDTDSPAAITDESGRWSFAQFSQDIQKVEVIFVRPDGARESFSTEGGDGLNQRPLISFTELKAQKLVVQLPEGVTVRGVVMDGEGKGLSGVRIKEGYGHGNIVRVSEFTTDSSGLFECSHRAPRQWIYTASRTDRATVSVVVQVERGMPEVRIVLPPAKPWSARVTDESGKPISDGEFRIDTYRTEAQILDWSGQTDADGRVVWTNAPRTNVTLYVTSKSLGTSRKVRIIQGEPERQIVLSKTASEKITVRGKAVDAGTKQPVKVESVAARFEGGGSPFKLLANPDASEFAVEIKRTDFRVGMYPSFELKLEAAGYESLTIEPIDFDFGDQNLELALRRSTGAREVTVLQPDGRPAPGARLWARATPGGDGTLYISGRGRYHGDRFAKEQADEGGRVKLPGVQSDSTVVIAHNSGFLETTMGEMRRQTDVRLRAYGTLEGKLLVAGKPKGGVNINLNTLAWSPSLGFHLSYTATTDPDGRFTFTQVPPGNFKLYRWALPQRRDTTGLSITETYQMPVTIVAGQTNTVEYSSAGRAVIGQAVPEPMDVAVDWRNDIHTLSLKLPSAPAGGRVNREDYATFAAFLKANSASYLSQAQVQNARQARTYALEFEMDGTFRIEDVPPGTYELRIRVTKPDESGRRPSVINQEELGSLIREVVVPDGKETLDLGTLAVPMRGVTLTAPMTEVPSTRGAPPIALNATTLDGKPLTLAQFKGTNILLVFWAAWSERSQEHLVEVQKLHAQLASDARITFVGVSLDDTAEPARKIVEALGCRWMQSWVDAEGRAKLAAAFDVNTLPAVFLLDSEGRIVGRELEGERLPATVKRTLAKK